MGIFSVQIKVSGLTKKKRVTLKTVVDTGAFLSIVPESLLKQVGVKPMWSRQFTLANGSKIERLVGTAIFQVNGQEGSSEVIFGHVDDKPILGALTLEALGLKVNPRKQKLEPIDLLLL
jgi:clan AA aspartic protease